MIGSGVLNRLVRAASWSGTSASSVHRSKAVDSSNSVNEPITRAPLGRAMTLVQSTYR
jgi:hypothetical protein